MTTPFADAGCQPPAWLSRSFNPLPLRALRIDSNGVRELREGETLVLDQACGQGVVCLEGSLWITHDPQSRDDVVEPGAMQLGRADTRMLVHALADSRLCMPVPLAA